MKLNALLFFLVLVISSFSVSGQKIDVMTYNILYASFDSGPHSWDQRRQGIYTIVKGHDFVGMQEVLPVQITDIMENTEGQYAALFRTRDADPTSGEGSPILYNKSRWKVLNSGYYWLSDTPLVPGSNTWGAAFNRILTFAFFSDTSSGDSILVINTHFDHISQFAREKSIALILDKFGKYFSSMPVVFMGDLNSLPDNPVYTRIANETDLADSWLKAKTPEQTNGASFHGYTCGKPSERIDYIFTSPFLDIISSKVLYTQYNAEYPSDHFPVNTILSFKK